MIGQFSARGVTFMAHYGMLRDYRFSDDVDDIRGANLYGNTGKRLGKIDDVVFDHETGTIEYVIVDTGSSQGGGKFLVPATSIRNCKEHPDEFAIDASKEHIEALPRHDEVAMQDESRWREYEHRYREAWASGPVLHKEGSTHAITPEASEMPAGRGSGVGDPALMPERLAGKFPAANQDSSKLRMRPSGIAAKAEDSRLPGTFEPMEKPTLAAEEAERAEMTNPVQSQRDHLTSPDAVYISEGERHARWAAFEDRLRRNRVDITASCRSCGTARERVA
jgi:sporulation protein YlmC with PRC-barrel domain